jgi:oligopeptide transport system permease protein
MIEENKLASIVNTTIIRERRHHTLWGDAWVRLRRNKLAIAGGIFIIVLALAAIFAPLITPYSFAHQDLNAILENPSAKHWLGTDGLGRDIFARLLYGARTSLGVGIFAQLIVIGIGLPIGAIAGYSGGRVDNILMRFVDVMYGFPDLLLVILLKAVLGGGIYQLFLAIGLVAWVDIARLIRGQILSIKSRDFINAAHAMGGMGPYITWRHLLPNSLGPIIVSITFNIPRAIFTEAALSFIGIGVKPPTPSWGTMIYDGYAVIFASWYQVLVPALAIALLMIAFTFLGDGLRDALDPKMRH